MQDWTEAMVAAEVIVVKDVVVDVLIIVDVVGDILDEDVEDFRKLYKRYPKSLFSGLLFSIIEPVTGDPIRRP